MRHALATRRPIRTDRAGLAVARDLPPERLVVSARALDGRRGQAVVAITAGDETDAQANDDLWAALTNGHGIYPDDPVEDIPEEDDVLEFV